MTGTGREQVHLAAVPAGQRVRRDEVAGRRVAACRVHRVEDHRRGTHGHADDTGLEAAHRQRTADRVGGADDDRRAGAQAGQFGAFR